MQDIFDSKKINYYLVEVFEYLRKIMALHHN